MANLGSAADADARREERDAAARVARTVRGTAGMTRTPPGRWTAPIVLARPVAALWNFRCSRDLLGRWSSGSSARSQCSSTGSPRGPGRAEAARPARDAAAGRQRGGLARPPDRGAVGRAPAAGAAQTLDSYVSRLRSAARAPTASSAARPATCCASSRASSTSSASSALVAARQRSHAVTPPGGATAARGARALARPGARRRAATSRSPAARSSGSRSAARSRSRSGSTPTSRCGERARARARARGARPRAPVPRAPARPADARALPRGPPGRRARGLPRGAPAARRRARARAGPQLRELERQILRQDREARRRRPPSRRARAGRAPARAGARRAVALAAVAARRSAGRRRGDDDGRVAPARESPLGRVDPAAGAVHRRRAPRRAPAAVAAAGSLWSADAGRRSRPADRSRHAAQVDDRIPVERPARQRSRPAAARCGSRARSSGTVIADRPDHRTR